MRNYEELNISLFMLGIIRYHINNNVAVLLTTMSVIRYCINKELIISMSTYIIMLFPVYIFSYCKLC